MSRKVGAFFMQVESVRRSDRAAAAGPRRVPIAVARPIVDLVTGALTPATVLAAHTKAVVLVVEPLAAASAVTGGTDTARIVTLTTREGSGVPNGARTAFTAADQPFAGLHPGDAAFVGAGGIRVGSHHFHAVRAVRTEVPRIVAHPDSAHRIARRAAAAARGVADAPVAALRDALAAADASRLRAAVRALVGLGAGSTPGGDDVLSGTMAGLLATGRDVPAQQIAAAALPDVASRTPLMSADLLRLAATGNVCEEAGAVLRAAAAPTRRPRTPHSPTYPAHPAVDALDAALTGLIAIGHTSGADLATGLAIGLGVGPLPEPRRPRLGRRRAAAVGATPAARADQ